MLDLSSPVLQLCGILFLAIITIETGGYYLTRVARGHVEATEFQRSFHRAGHGHAGVLVTLGIVAAILSDATNLEGAWLVLARSGIAGAAILMPAGFFFSSMGAGRTSANHLIWLVWAGALLLALGAGTLGVGLIAAS